MIVPRRAWLALGILFVARLGLGYQFQSAGSASPFLIERFGIAYTEIGDLIGLYMFAGIALALPMGYLGRRFGDKRVILSGLALMVLGGWLQGIAGDYATLFAGRLLCGAGAVGLFVISTKMVADWFHAGRLVVAMSVFILGWPIGIAAGAAGQGVLAEWTSVSFVFHSTAVIALATFVLFLFMPAAPQTTPQTTPQSAPETVGGAAPGRRLSGRELWLVTLIGLTWMFINSAYGIVLGFGPTYLLAGGRGLVEAGLIVSAVSWVFMFGLPLGGYLGGQSAGARFGPGRIMLLGLAACTVCVAAIPFTGLDYLTFGGFGFAMAVSAPIIAALPGQVLRPESRGLGFGIYYLCYYVGNAAFPALAGRLRDATAEPAAPITFSVLLMAASLACTVLFCAEQRRLARPAMAG